MVLVRVIYLLTGLFLVVNGHLKLSVEEKCCFKVDTDTNQIVDTNGEIGQTIILTYWELH